jgi:hypothetical protein
MVVPFFALLVVIVIIIAFVFFNANKKDKGNKPGR